MLYLSSLVLLSLIIESNADIVVVIALKIKIYNALRKSWSLGALV